MIRGNAFGVRIRRETQRGLGDTDREVAIPFRLIAADLVPDFLIGDDALCPIDALRHGTDLVPQRQVILVQKPKLAGLLINRTDHGFGQIG